MGVASAGDPVTEQSKPVNWVLGAPVSAVHSHAQMHFLPVQGGMRAGI
jgi:hypothetical protein